MKFTERELDIMYGALDGEKPGITLLQTKKPFILTTNHY